VEVEAVVTPEGKEDAAVRTSASRTVTVTHQPGLHARPCLAIVKAVRAFRSKITLRHRSRVANAGEILEVMSLGVPTGDEVTLTATGPDAEEAIEALVRLFETNFGFED
jgi:phosphocarrier protein